jgi:transcriptional regulator with GAF, ATPase, and Fis domain
MLSTTAQEDMERNEEFGMGNDRFRVHPSDHSGTEREVQNGSHHAPRPVGKTLETVERDYILAVLQQTNWVINGPRGAAQILGLHPNTLRNRMKKLGVARSSP